MNITGRFLLADSTPISGQVIAERDGETFATTLHNGEIPETFKLSSGRYVLRVVVDGETVWGPQTVDVPFFCRRVDLNRLLPR